MKRSISLIKAKGGLKDVQGGGTRNVSFNKTTPLAEFIATTCLEGNLATWGDYN